ncbi:MAG TPA: branched-chain amino acid ABC transporter permease [Chitinivibrionales bacterium]|nr:branched-chain amino acid ABC transporter permease [Chitinivibrionales bacterium]
MISFFHQSLNALQLGSIYALIALGYTMVYGVLRLINFAHGDIFMIGSYLALFLAVYFHLPFVAIVPLTFAAIAFLGVSIEKLAYRPLRSAPRVSAVITALSVGIFLETITLAVAGPEPRKFPELAGYHLYKAGAFAASNVQLLIISASLLLMAALEMFVAKTRTGMAMRALSWDKFHAPLLGINIDRIISYTFAIGTGLASVAGIFVGLAYPIIDPYMGIMVGWKAFVSAVIGGIGSIKGAVAGGFLLGIVEIISASILPSSYKDMIVFGLLLLILLIRPSGLFGLPMQKKV